jgi:methyl-accepting chemotaxis protein
MNDKAQKYIIASALLIGIIAGWYLFSGNGAGDGARLDAIRSDIQRVEEQQRNITARLDKISAGLDRGIKATETVAARIAGIEGTVDEVAGRINSGKSRIEASARLIDEGQQRIDDIRKGTKANPETVKN